MSVEKAKAHYIGKPGHQKLNCAQTVVHAFKDKFGLEDDAVAGLAAHGGGRAPGGQCGALYAARVMLEQKHPQLIKSCEDVLLAHAGSLKCSEIRALKKLSCVGCVEKIAECVERA